MPGTMGVDPKDVSRVLLDTHTLVWALTHPERLGRKVRRALETGDSLASVASLWELVIKGSRPGSLLADPLTWWTSYVGGAGIRVLAIEQRHVEILASLPARHKDPFDRILVAQAIVENAVLASKDEALRLYGVKVIW